jgi:hypothetical protein
MKETVRSEVDGKAAGRYLAWLLLAAAWLVTGCTAMPGAVPELNEDKPDDTWTESRLRETYGAPRWTAPLADGGKALFFDYKTAPSDKTLSALTAVTTFGLIRDAGSLDFERLAILDANGELVCADRDSLNYGDHTCSHERRLALLDELAGSQREAYLGMLIRLDRRQYAPGHYELVAGPLLSNDEIAAVRASGGSEPFATDGAYYFAAECAVLAPWYAAHLSALGKSPQAADRSGPVYATAFHRMSAARGESVTEAAWDLALLRAHWQPVLDRGHTAGPGNAARACLSASPGDWSSATLKRIDDAYFARLDADITLAKALAVRDYPDDPAGRSLPYQVQPPRDTPMSVGMPYSDLPEARAFGQLKRHSTSWRTALSAEQEALRRSLTVDALATPVDVVERVIDREVSSGQVPGRDALKSLLVALESRLVTDDHEGAMKAIAAAGRYYLAQPPGRNVLARAGNTFGSAAWLAERIGQGEQAASLSLLAGEVYLAMIGSMLADNGLADPVSRDTVRDIVNFVPYRYERTDWQGNVWEYEVNRPAFDAEGMLSLITDLSRNYGPAAAQLGHSVPYFLEPMAAGQFFEEQAIRANERFSSKGASFFYQRASRAYEAGGAEQLALVANLRSQINLVRSEQASGRQAVSRSCEWSYLPVRKAFAERFGDPDYRQIGTLFGEHLADTTRETDRRCRF